MKSSFNLGKIFGVEIGIHYTWLFIAVLICVTLIGRFSATHPEWPSSIVWATAVSTTLLFFATLIVHELSHAVVANAYKMPVKSITLFALGGVANIERESETAKAEFWMGIVGPIVSAIIGALCLFAASSLGWSPPETASSPVASSLAWLGYINLTLAAFNMIPAFPLDGGRVLKAIIWWVTKDAEKSAGIAARCGQVMAALFIGAGILLVVTTGSFSGFWLAIIGWFLIIAATATVAQNEVVATLKDMTAADAMSSTLVNVPADMPLSRFVKARLSTAPHHFYLVTSPTDEENIIGLITPHDVAKVQQHNWPTKTVDEVMVPLERAKVTEADAPIIEALKTMNENHINQLPVVANHRIVGILSRDNVIQLVQNRKELGSRTA